MKPFLRKPEVSGEVVPARAGVTATRVGWVDVVDRAILQVFLAIVVDGARVLVRLERDIGRERAGYHVAQNRPSPLRGDEIASTDYCIELK